MHSLLVLINHGMAVYDACELTDLAGLQVGLYELIERTGSINIVERARCLVLALH